MHKNLILISILFVSLIQTIYAIDDNLQQPEIRAGFFINSFAEIQREDITIALQIWVDEISKKINISSITYVYDDIDTMRKDFYQDKINFIAASPLPIVDNFDPKLLADGYKMVWSGSAEDNLLVITHKHAQLHDFSALKNKKLSLLFNDSTAQTYADVLALETFGKKADQVFKKINTKRKSGQLILDLFFKKTDVILVYQGLYDLTCELNPQIRNNTQIISTLPNIPRTVGFFHARVDPAFRNAVLTQVNQLHHYARGRQLLEIFKADKFVRSSVADLQSTRQLKQRYQQLINQNKNHQ